MEKIAKKIENLLVYAHSKLGLGKEDLAYTRNQLLEYLQVEPSEEKGEYEELDLILPEIIDYAIDNEIEEEGTELRVEAKIMGMVTPSPGLVIKNFFDIKEKEGASKATDYLYNLSIDNTYVRLNDIRKNIRWYAEGSKGRIAITINLSKPEKDPKQVLAERQSKAKKYPKCLLCMENIGFRGTATHPARQNLRIIPVTLEGESWHMQYSPYLYYDEHCIVFNDEHVPMKITEKTISRLLQFVEQYDHYFLGSNADLPIVGGSILSHDHYQGGKKVLPMLSRPMKKIYSTHNGVTVGIKNWYNSVVTVRGEDKNEVACQASIALNFWKIFSDDDVDIYSDTSDDVIHNTVTPVAYKKDGEFYVDLILRNNRTDEKHPYGIFHPTEDMHNIKKEAIGLIEAMGLFILPGRLKDELATLMIELQKENPDVSAIENDERVGKHAQMFKEIIKESGTGLNPTEARIAVLKKVDEICFKILECTAVYKNTVQGRTYFNRFMELLTCKIEYER